MKEEFKLMKQNCIWDLVELPKKNGIDLGVRIFLRLRMSLMILSKITRSDLLPSVLLRKMKIDYEDFFYHFPRKTHYELLWQL